MQCKNNVFFTVDLINLTRTKVQTFSDTLVVSWCSKSNVNRETLKQPFHKVPTRGILVSFHGFIKRLFPPTVPCIFMGFITLNFY